jgi:hypothetical protein
MQLLVGYLVWPHVGWSVELLLAEVGTGFYPGTNLRMSLVIMTIAGWGAD